MSEGFDRRSVLVGGAALAASSALGASKKSPKRMPTLFLAHGAPTLLDDATWMSQLRGWAKKLPKPKSILMLSAHWEERPLTIGATTTVPLVYDFYGFPEPYYQQKYPAPGAPELAERISVLVGENQSVAQEPKRGLDHGAYVPLVAMYPDADVPVLQASLPSLEPKELLELGKKLAPLRDEGVLIIGSGFIVHNLRVMRQLDGETTPSWASEFDGWNAEKLKKKDVDALLDYRARAPGVQMSLPTHEHYVPLLAALGAGLDANEVSFPITGYWFGAFTKRSVQFG